MESAFSHVVAQISVRNIVRNKYRQHHVKMALAILCTREDYPCAQSNQGIRPNEYWIWLHFNGES